MSRSGLVTAVIPTRNEADNIRPLLARIAASVGTRPIEVLFVDDSTDGTPEQIELMAAESTFPVSVLHRDRPTGGLGGAVLEGMRRANGAWVLVMDADLQHSPEVLPILIDTALTSEVDLVIGSRYLEGGSVEGLDGPLRVFFSQFGTHLAKALFPRRFRDVTDPMSGFFTVRLAAVPLSRVRPRGFKILLEILARSSLRVAEVPAPLAARAAGESKADVVQVWRLTRQFTSLRFAGWVHSVFDSLTPPGASAVHAARRVP
ncbi:glycosyltransferase [Gryllotalpicola sp.]|uniref:glycosyltransferase n=1 Tax=Gryllotalpicola sp. TaxID=1932787 RepID=UPI0026128F75|nr:glycosyltransferase [Gryllotalpicola sp.]